MIEILLLTLSFTGYFLFFSRKTGKIFDAASPAVTCSFIIIAVNIGGIIGILPATVTILLWLGIGLIPVTLLLYRLKKTKTRYLSVFLLAIFLICCMLFAFELNKQLVVIYHYDNFSHWGIIARFLYRTNHFPGVDDTNIISFTSYPVGSACFLYYVCSVLKNDASPTMLIAQSLLIFCYYFSLFTSLQRYIDKTRDALHDKKIIKRVLCFPWLESISALALIFILCFYNTQLHNLLVDNLLSATGLSAILICLNNEDHLNKRILDISLILGASLAIKNSGLFLALFCVILFIITQVDKRKELMDEQCYNQITGGTLQTQPRFALLKSVILLLIIPIIIFILWKIHCSPFSASKHSMSLSSYVSKISNMSTAERQGIINIILPRMLDLDNNEAILLFIGSIVLSCIGYSIKLDRDRMFRYGFFVTLVFLVYEIGTLLMYEFSMSYAEVISQNGNDYFRYNGTIVSIIAGFVFHQLISLRPRFTGKRSVLGIALVLVCTAAVYLNISPGLQPIVSKETINKRYSDWVTFEKVSNSIVFTTDDRILVRYSKDYNVPKNATNYFVLPCTNYINAYSTKEVNWRLSEGEYTYVIDLVEKTITHNGTVTPIT